MSFELCNAPSIFIRLMNKVLKPFTSTFLVVYFDIILIISRSKDDHVNHLRAILEKLREEKFVPKLQKMQIPFLGFVISSHVI